MILCLGVTGAGKSMLLKCLKDRSALLLTGDLPEVVVNLDDDPQPVGPAPLLASVATVGTDLIKLSRPGSKRNSCPEGLSIFKLFKHASVILGNDGDSFEIVYYLFATSFEIP